MAIEPITPSYTISDSNSVSIFFNEGAERPVYIQNAWPDGTAWADKATAEKWAQQFIASINDDTKPTADFGPNIPGFPQKNISDADKARFLQAIDDFKQKNPGVTKASLVEKNKAMLVTLAQ